MTDILRRDRCATRALFIGVAALVLSGCSEDTVDPAVVELPPPGALGAPLSAFVDVQVISMTTDAIDRGWTVVVRDGRIDDAGPSTDIEVPSGAVIIRGENRYLMPGLVDAHVHLRTADAPEYVRYGVTTVRNMWGYPTLWNLMASIADGEIIGPTAYSYSSGLDAAPVYWPFTQLVETPAAGRAAVAEQLDAGWIGIKVYDDLSRSAYDAIVAAATARGMPVVGHVPRNVELGRALSAGQRSIEHLTGYARALGSTSWRDSIDPEWLRSLSERTAAAGTWNCPTLAIQARNAGHDNRGRVVRALHDAGAGLLAGSDAGIDRTLPGQGLRDELRLLVQAGLTPYEALRAATVDVAHFLERDGEFGVVAVGARADLLLLEANPLERIENVGSLAGVMLRGLWIPGD